jgi:uncharacterized membrane protein
MVIGNFLSRIEPNWFIGIRTPWTLSSDRVWRQTHRAGGWMLVVGGALIVLTVFVPQGAALPILIVTIGVVAVVPVVWSYLLWKRERAMGS